MTDAPIASTDEVFAWDVIAQVSVLLSPVAEATGGTVMAAFEVVEDALADRRLSEVALSPSIIPSRRGGTDAA